MTISPDGKRIAVVIAKWAEAIRDAARMASPDHAISVWLPATLPEDVVVEGIDVALSSCAVLLGDELVRGDFDKADFMPSRHEVADLLRLEVTPFIVGVGRVIFDCGLEGFVLRRADGHESSSDVASSTKSPCGTAVTPEMIEAGAEALREYDYRFESIESAIRRIFISVLTGSIQHAPEV